MIDINSLTISQVNEIKNLFNSYENKNNPYKKGEKYLIRTVTFYYTGLLEEIFDRELVFSKAAWIADTGRYSTCLKIGELNEVEPIMGNVIISRGSIIDCVIWNHDLPSLVK